VISLVVLVGGAMLVNLILARPDGPALVRGLLPDRQVLTDPQQLYLAMGILGATVMPRPGTGAAVAPSAVKRCAGPAWTRSWPLVWRCSSTPRY
jgi:hypothetical protein